MGDAISNFSDEEKDYAKAEIDAFKENPENIEINSIVSKIYEGIGKTAKADSEKQIAEQNAANVKLEDIFSVVETTKSRLAEDTDIF